MAHSLLLFSPSCSGIQRLEFEIPVGCVLESQSYRLQVFLVTAICFLFHTLYFLEHYLTVLFVSISSTKWWRKKNTKKKEFFKTVIKQERNVNPFSTRNEFKKTNVCNLERTNGSSLSSCTLNTELKCAWPSEQMWNKISARCESGACGGSGLGSSLLWSVVPSVGGTFGVWQIRGETGITARNLWPNWVIYR